MAFNKERWRHQAWSGLQTAAELSWNLISSVGFTILELSMELYNIIPIGSMSWIYMEKLQFIRILWICQWHSVCNVHSSELKWSGGWSTGTVGWLSTSERGQDLEGWPAMNTKCLVPLPFLPDLILWSTDNLSHGSPVLVPPETQ